MTQQLDLFASEQPVTDDVLRHEAHFGKWDAKSGLGIRNRYSKQLSGARLAAYEAAWREEVAGMMKKTLT